jgi:hypothetical protein
MRIRTTTLTIAPTTTPFFAVCLGEVGKVDRVLQNAEAEYYRGLYGKKVP